MVGRVLTGNGITRYGDGLYTLIGVEELSDSERDALLQLCRQRQDHLLLLIQVVHGGAPWQSTMLDLQLNCSFAAQSASER
jgi:hypothetical protein